MAKNNAISFSIPHDVKTIQCEECGFEFLLFVVLRAKDGKDPYEDRDQILGPVLTWDYCPGCTKPLGDPEHMKKKDMPE